MISVVMSVYNAEKYLKEAIESVLNQTYQNFELIIVNDCSSDGSVVILQDYQKRYECINLIHNESNLGLTKNLNLALSIAKGEYIARMDADDVCDIERFQKQIDFLNKNESIDILGTFTYDVDGDGKTIRSRTVPVTHNEIMTMLPKLSPIVHPSVMFRRERLAKIGFYNPKYRTSQDLEMWFRAAGAGLKFHNIPEYLFKYRVDGDFLARKNFRFRWNDFKLRLEGYKCINLSWYKYGFALIPIILGMIPSPIYALLKKMDPR